MNEGYYVKKEDGKKKSFKIYKSFHFTETNIKLP